MAAWSGCVAVLSDSQARGPEGRKNKQRRLRRASTSGSVPGFGSARSLAYARCRACGARVHRHIGRRAAKAQLGCGSLQSLLQPPHLRIHIGQCVLVDLKPAQAKTDASKPEHAGCRCTGALPIPKHLRPSSWVGNGHLHHGTGFIDFRDMSTSRADIDPPAAPELAYITCCAAISY